MLSGDGIGWRTMNIEQIREIRATVRSTEQEYFDAHSVEIVDTLLAEVERLKDGYAMVVDNLAYAQKCQERAESSLTIATEALSRIENSSTHPGDRRQIARTALERIK